MISVKRAYRIATRKKHGELTECYELAEAYAFYFEDGDGSPFVLIDKTTGKESYMLIPPISNIEILESGTRIPVEDATT